MGLESPHFMRPSWKFWLLFNRKYNENLKLFHMGATRADVEISLVIIERHVLAISELLLEVRNGNLSLSASRWLSP